ncbi:unnamed protein product [Gordionus sp. m RMFG-2023]
MPAESTLRSWSQQIEIRPGFLDSSFKRIKTFQSNSHLLRNLLGDKKFLINNNNGTIINCKYIKNLHNLQDKERLRAANKIGRSHLEYHKQKMKIKLAVQDLFPNSNTF